MRVGRCASREDTNARAWQSPPAGSDNGQMKTQVDHLVVLAASLDDGERWCERVLGLRPDAGGRHTLMGTHNRLLKIASAAYPNAYLEIIAIEPGAVPTRDTGTRRWFDMDDPLLAQSVAQDGPRLIHWVARTNDIDAACQRWLALGLDRGPPLAAERMSPQGLLSWRITVRDDGARLLDGCLPTLIEWASPPPGATLPETGVALIGLRIQHPEPPLLNAAWLAAGLTGASIESGRAQIEAWFQTPNGQVVISSLAPAPFQKPATAPSERGS